MKKQILRSLLWRHNKYWEVFLSRHEYYKFGVTEWEMRKTLRELRRMGLNIVGKRYCWEGRFANAYKLSEELITYIKKELGKIQKGFDIVKFNAEVTKEYVENLFWLKVRHKNTVLSNETGSYKYTFNSEYNIITRWDKWGWWGNKWFNFFNWVKELFWLWTRDILNLI